MRQASKVLYINWTLIRVQAIENEKVKELAKQVDQPMAIKEELFDKVSAFNALLKKIRDNEFCKNEAETK